MANHNESFHLHGHDFSELIFVLGGKANHIVSDYSYPIREGDIFTIHPGLKHGFNKPENLQLMNFMFSWKTPLIEISLLNHLPGFHHLFTLDPLLRQAGEFQTGLTLSGAYWNEIQNIGSQIFNEYSLGNEGFEGMIQALFQLLVISLSRRKILDSVVSTPGSQPLARAMAFLEETYREKIQLNDIADAACVSSRHISRLFQTMLNTSPFEYLNNIRLQKARSLLSQSTISISEISDQCGFSDSNYFSRVFKDQEGISPRIYRNSFL
jgi:AraC family L-rhamnose operon regulatory protein RhaS